MRRRGTAPLALDGGGYGSEPQARRKAVLTVVLRAFLGGQATAAGDRLWMTGYLRCRPK